VLSSRLLAVVEIGPARAKHLGARLEVALGEVIFKNLEKIARVAIKTARFGFEMLLER